MRNNRLIRKYLISFILLIAILIVGFFIVYTINKNYASSTQEEAYIDYVEYDGKKYKQNDDLTLLLFAGLDSYDNELEDSYRNFNLSDCLVLLVLDNQNKTILPIQINRDTMCNYHVLGIGGQIVDSAYGQIALAHTYGSGDLSSLVNTKDAVSKLLNDINIDYYVSLPMNAVIEINDRAGGVTVLVEDDFSSIDSSVVMGEEVKLTGRQALTFVRARSGMDDASNIARMKRQKVYLRALYETSKKLVNEDSDFVFDTLENISDYLIANTNTYGLSDLADTLFDYELLEAVTLKGEASKGSEYIEYYVDENWLQEFCINNFYKEID